MKYSFFNDMMMLVNSRMIDETECPHCNEISYNLEYLKETRQVEKTKQESLFMYSNISCPECGSKISRPVFMNLQGRSNSMKQRMLNLGWTAHSNLKKEHVQPWFIYACFHSIRAMHYAGLTLTPTIVRSLGERLSKQDDFNANKYMMYIEMYSNLNKKLDGSGNAHVVYDFGVTQESHVYIELEKTYKQGLLVSGEGEYD